MPIRGQKCSIVIALPWLTIDVCTGFYDGGVGNESCCYRNRESHKASVASWHHETVYWLKKDFDGASRCVSNCSCILLLSTSEKAYSRPAKRVRLQLPHATVTVRHCAIVFDNREAYISATETIILVIRRVSAKSRKYEEKLIKDDISGLVTEKQQTVLFSLYIGCAESECGDWSFNPENTRCISRMRNGNWT